MPDLFGVDFQEVTRDVFEGQLVTLTLSVPTDDVEDPDTGGVTLGTPTTYTFSGISSSIQERWEEFTTIQDGDSQVLILAGTIRDTSSALQVSVTPKPGDSIVDDRGETMTILRVLKRDPAAATWLVHAR